MYTYLPTPFWILHKKHLRFFHRCFAAGDFSHFRSLSHRICKICQGGIISDSRIAAFQSIADSVVQMIAVGSPCITHISNDIAC